jgi:hypothetical protein
MCLRYDGLSPHFGRVETAFFKENYEEKWLGRGTPVAWSPRSPDLKHIVFLLWDCMESVSQR